MIMTPLRDQILIKRLARVTHTPAGVLIPDAAQEVMERATVIAVGGGRINERTGERIPMDVTVGDVVIVHEYNGTEVTLDGEDYLVIDDSDVLGILS